jgi:NDP-sugar pyrophosphorylase family protein
VTGSRLGGGIIAAGDGSRLRESGWSLPKALVSVAGVPLIERAIRNFLAVGITAPVIIVNEQARACVDWVRARFPALQAEFIVKPTSSSLESFREVSRRLQGTRALISAVDTWCREADFVRFVEGALRYPAEDSVLAATSLVADETPVWLTADDGGRIATLGGPSGTLVTAGLYLLSAPARAAAPPPLGRLREYLGWLVQKGYPLYAETIRDVVDVDRASDVALAEVLARGRTDE